MNWSPAAWNDVSVVALVILMAAVIGFALVRGWLVLGPHHREVVSAKDKTIDNADRRSERDQDTIAVQAKTILEKNATEQASAYLLQAIREIADGREST